MAYVISEDVTLAYNKKQITNAMLTYSLSTHYLNRRFRWAQMNIHDVTELLKSVQLFTILWLRLT